MAAKIRTGIYGGSFNPVHNGHIAIAREVRAKAGLDEVWLMVSPQNPLKSSTGLLDDALRLDMVRRAVEGEDGLVASDYEFARPRPSYTWDTLCALRRDFTDREFVLLIGADNWSLFSRWYHGDDIISHHQILIYPRTGYPVDASALPPGVRLVDTGLYDVSSTLVRRLVGEGRDISRLVPPSVAGMVERYYKTVTNV